MGRSALERSTLMEGQINPSAVTCLASDIGLVISGWTLALTYLMGAVLFSGTAVTYERVASSE